MRLLLKKQIIGKEGQEEKEGAALLFLSLDTQQAMGFLLKFAGAILDSPTSFDSKTRASVSARGAMMVSVCRCVCVCV